MSKAANSSAWRCLGRSSRHPASSGSSLITLAPEARRRGWWQQYSVTPWFEVYVGLEEEACEIRSYEAEAIPGLLQTEGYARAVMLADVDVPADEEIQRRIAVRNASRLMTRPECGWC